MSLYGHRRESLRIEKLDLNDNLIGPYVYAGTGLKLEDSTGTTIKTGGTMDVVDDSTDWLKIRIQVFYTTNGVEYSLGVFIPATPTGNRASGGGLRQVELYDKTLILQEDVEDKSYVVKKGTNVTNHVRALIQSSGEPRVSIEASDAVTNVQTVWNPGTPRLQIVNDLLSSINYTGLRATDNGILESVPNIDYEKKTPVWTFDDTNSTGLYMDDFGDEQDLFAIPNKWVGLTRSDGDEASFKSVITNEDPNSPFSYQNRGRWITRVTENVEAVSQQVLDSIILGNLTRATNASRKFTISHPWVPLNLNDTVKFINTEFGINTTCRVTKMSMDMTLPGALVTTTLWELGSDPENDEEGMDG